MKKLSLCFSLLLPACTLLTSSCSDNGSDSPDGPSVEISVNVSDEALETGPEAATLSLTVEATADWSITTDADWATLRPKGGIKNEPTNIKISVGANTTMDERVADLRITSGGKTIKNVSLTQGYTMNAVPSTKSMIFSGAESKQSITVTSNGDWTLSTSASWLEISPAKGGKGETKVDLKATANNESADRETTLTLTCGDVDTEIKITQLSDAIVIPEGYTLVWSDEFNGGPSLGRDWVAENWPAGYVNNELQIYTSKPVDGKSTLVVENGMLNINCFKAADGKIYSGRINALPNTGWTYGYFEARINLPKGKGTWPAFWMMPCNVDWNTNGWPRCGEIDIMEEVGADPDRVSSSLHTMNYNHTINTQITHEMYCAGAEGSFHVYALEWTEDEIITYVDGKVQLRASRASMGTSHESWPFHYAFYPILNLAWGGDWGDYKGVDEKVLPVTMKVDYVRIFQKK